MEYQFYKTLNIAVAGLSVWICVDKDRAKRALQATAEEEKIIDHRDVLRITYQQLRLPDQDVAGKPVMNTLPNKRVNWKIGTLDIRLYPSQLRAMHHIHQQVGIRLCVSCSFYTVFCCFLLFLHRFSADFLLKMMDFS